MERIGQLGVGHLVVVGEAAASAQPPLGVLQRLAGAFRLALEVGRVDVPIAQLAGQGLQDVALFVGGADAVAALHDHPVVPLVGEVEAGLLEVGVDVAADFLAVGLGGGAHVHRGNVVGLVEVVQHHLPVAGQPHAVGHGAPPSVDVAQLPLVPDRPQVFLEAHALRVHVHPDEAGEGLAAQLRQPHLAAGIALREVVLVGGEVERAVGQVGPTVVLADEALDAALVVLDERVAAMLADVVERLHPAVLLADHQDLLGPHRLHLPVAGVGQFRFAAEQQPDLGPHALLLLLEERP